MVGLWERFSQTHMGHSISNVQVLSKSAQEHKGAQEHKAARTSRECNDKIHSKVYD